MGSEHGDLVRAAEPLIFERSVAGRRGWLPPRPSGAADAEALIPEAFRRTVPPRLPEVSELDVVRHFTRLSQLNFSVDTHFYPLDCGTGFRGDRLGLRYRVPRGQVAGAACSLRAQR